MNWKQINRSIGGMELFLLDQLLKGRIPEGSKILDAGCAEGRNLHYFLSNHYEIEAIDHYPMAIRLMEMVAKSRKYEGKARLNAMVGDVRDLPYPNDSFDVVFAIALLHCMDNQQAIGQAMEQFHRVLKPNGLLILQTAAQTDSQQEAYQEEVLYRISEPELENLLHHYSFELEEPIRIVRVKGIQKMLQAVVKKQAG